MKIFFYSCLVICVGAVLLIGVLVWLLFSWTSTGYSVSNGKVIFQTFDNANWKTVYSNVVDADAASFQSIRGAGGKYGADSQQVFFKMNAIEDADVSTFKVLDWRQGFSRDKSAAFYERTKLSDDPDHFQVMPRAYSKDQQQVYFLFHPIQGADPETFEVVDPVMGKARDKHGTYFGGKRER